MSDTEQRQLAAAMRRLERLRRAECFDPNFPESKPTPAQREIIDDFGIVRTQWIVSSNRSGKSQTCAWILAHVLQDTHPTWKIPDSWKREGLLILVAGKNSKQIEESLWYKIRSYLEPGTYKEIRIGNILQKVEIESSSPELPKHRIIFQSMENVTQARERVQSYDAHIAWADEMIDSPTALNEIRLRVTTKGGFFLCSFTPLLPSPDVKRLIDGAVLPHAKKYRLRALDNPVFDDVTKRAEFLSTFVGASDQERATRLEGEWATGEGAVYYFNPETMVAMPEGYSPMWRHTESVDPATQSALGLTIWAEDPKTNIWYLILAEYIKGIYVPTEIIKAVQAYTSRLNIVRRICDPEASWYINQASSTGISYMGVRKNGRKHDLIKQLQQCLGQRIRIAPHCEHYIRELQECRWSEQSSGKIINSSRFHLLDSSHYFCDAIPAPPVDKRIQSSSWQDWLYQVNDKRKANVERAKSKLMKGALRKGRAGRRAPLQRRGTK